MIRLIMRKCCDDDTDTDAAPTLVDPSHAVHPPGPPTAVPGAAPLPASAPAHQPTYAPLARETKPRRVRMLMIVRGYASRGHAVAPHYVWREVEQPLAKGEQLSMFGARHPVQVRAHDREGHPVAAHTRMIVSVPRPTIDLSRGPIVAKRASAYNADVWGPTSPLAPKLREDAMGEGGKTSGPVSETRVWRQHVDGYEVGDVKKIKGHDGWRTITSASKAKTGKRTEADEDMGHGVEGDLYTEQQITHRPATPEEAAAADQREAAAEAARLAKDPGHLYKLWKEANPTALAIDESASYNRSREIAAMPLAWTVHADQAATYPHVGHAWSTATGPDGRQFGRMTYRGRDDNRVTYHEVVPADEAATRATTEAAAKRAKRFAMAEHAGFTHARNLKHLDAEYGPGDALDAPQTPEEHAAVTRGRQVDTDRAAIRERLAALETTVILTEADIAEIRKHFDVPVKDYVLGRQDRPRWQDHSDDLNAGRQVAGRAQSKGKMNAKFQTTPWPAGMTHDLALEDGLRRLDAKANAHRAKKWDGQLPQLAGHNGQPVEHPANAPGKATWDYIDALETFARARGTLPWYADEIAAARQDVIARNVQRLTSKKDRVDVARTAAESSHPYDHERFRAVVQANPGLRTEIPKKVADALAAKGLTG